ncbi:MAG: polymer-forming cytoskeletal protein [Alphaproteobacteria bacterium]|jgi:cytoskeletal protein CcmA (bactofilin family)|nr:polymer-forming cytoskeletal protein [Alphaproteobacteria bacterium]
MPSTINAELTVVGDLESEGQIDIDGHIEGKVNARSVSVGERGHVKGAILAQDVQISGTVEGEIGAMTVSLTVSAVVNADITYRTLSMEAGAFLLGHLHGTESPEPSG